MDDQSNTPSPPTHVSQNAKIQFIKIHAPCLDRRCPIERLRAFYKHHTPHSIDAPKRRLEGFCVIGEDWENAGRCA